MTDVVMKIILEALAMHIDRLKGEVFIKGLENERLKEENKKLQAENERLQESENFFITELKGEEIEDA